MKQLSLFVAIFIALACSATASADTKIVAPQGAIHGALESELQNGRWELVMFWATYCHVCKKDFEKLAKFMQENSSVPMTIVGVVTDCADETAKTNSLVEKNDLDYTHILTDYPQANAVYEDYAGQRLIGTPSYLLYNPDNKLVAFNANSIDLDALEILVYE